ncbi:MAG: FAD-binding protein, partial [Parvibaculum sp.]
AARAGALIADPEFVQFHPTAIAGPRDPAPLVTEALRGEGAILVNKAGQRFMAAIHADAELAPRDIVARAIFREIAAGRGAFLDARPALGDRFASAFPTVYENCMALGIDPARQAIPVAPAAHYHMGGIHVDARGRSSVEGLWACGEVASTGMHGANRLASNSLLEAIVFGARIAADIDGAVPEGRAASHIAPPVLGSAAATDAPFVSQLRQIMTAHVGVEREGEGLAHALTEIARLERAAGPANLFGNIATTAKLIAASAFAREESRGGHYRTDFAEPRAAFRHRTFVTLKEAERIAEAAIENAHAPQNEAQASA